MNFWMVGSESRGTVMIRFLSGSGAVLDMFRRVGVRIDKVDVMGGKRKRGKQVLEKGFIIDENN